MLMLISSLYQDSVHLGKTLVDAERITEACYGLYREMKNHASDDPKAAEWASRMLSIAGEVHDIKKDNQRIAAGLSRLISDGKLGEYMSMRELGGVMAEANRNYAEALGKQVRLSFVSHTDLRVPVYALLSILNNLVANAIEALPGAGSVAVVAEEEKGRLVIRIRDDGPGIPAKYADVIFDPGFTTKFDPSGRPSTGIGLSYARQMAGELGGSLSVEAGPNGKGALFTIVLPVESLTEGEVAMRFFVVDDDRAIRHMLTDLIEDEELGTVAGTAEDGNRIDGSLLNVQRVDILIIDLLMPQRDGIETIRSLGDSFAGKIIMLSQVESKDMIAEAYALGVEYYITKPINRLEVLSVIRKVIERLRMERSIDNIRRSLSGLAADPGAGPRAVSSSGAAGQESILTAGRAHLAQMGMIGEPGSRDLLDLLQTVAELESESPFGHDFPLLKDIMERTAARRLGPAADASAVQKEVKASEQRIRRAVLQALTHVASLGLTDYNHPVFEMYASRFFDFTEVRRRMLELEDPGSPEGASPRLNIKKFLQMLFEESKRGRGP
ncbi:DNA-binding domain-containing protein [Paenibacillus sp. P25]|nr:DNA-binding domain-containing protein [Paenibacillus sp. P25]